MADDSLEESMMQALAASELLDAATDWAEVGLDAVLDDGVLKDIPIIGTIVGITKAAVSVRDKLFAKKILLFLVALEKVSHEQREKQLEKLAADPKERRRVGEQLLLLLDRLNDMRKPELLARAFEALIKEKISRAQYQGLANVIDSVNQEYLGVFARRYELRQFEGGIELDAENSDFLKCALLRIGIVVAGTVFMEGKPATYSEVQKTELADLFYNHVLNKTGA